MCAETALPVRSRPKPRAVESLQVSEGNTGTFLKVEWEWPDWVEQNSNLFIVFQLHRRRTSYLVNKNRFEDTLSELTLLKSVYYPSPSGESHFVHRDYEVESGSRYEYMVVVTVTDPHRGASGDSPPSEIIEFQAVLATIKPEPIYVALENQSQERFLPNGVLRCVSQLDQQPRNFMFPDLATRAFGRFGVNGDLLSVRLTIANRRSYLLQGSSFRRQDLSIQCDFDRPDEGAIYLSHRDINPGHHRFEEWISAIRVNPERPDEVFALIHNEFHGDDPAVNDCAADEIHSHSSCWYNTLTSATSRDGGMTFRQRDLFNSPHGLLNPDYLIGIPFRYPTGGAGSAIGYFNTTNIFSGFRSDNDEVYVMFHAQAHGRQERGTCLARLRFSSDAGVYRPVEIKGWDGEDFNVTFRDPYSVEESELGDLQTSQVCAVVSHDEIGAIPRSVIRVEIPGHRLHGRFILVGAGLRGFRGSIGSGIFYSISQDDPCSPFPTRWSPRKLLKSAAVPIGRIEVREGDPTPVIYPSLIPHDSPSLNFDVAVSHLVHLYFQEQFYRLNPIPGDVFKTRTFVRGLVRQVLDLNRLR